MSSVYEEEQDNLVAIFFVVGCHIATMISTVTGNHSGLAKRFHQQRLATDVYMGPCRVKLWDDAE